MEFKKLTKKKWIKAVMALNGAEPSGNAQAQAQAQAQANGTDGKLKAWLKANRLEKIQQKLADHDVETLDDLSSLDNEEDITAFAEELGLNTISKKKFIKKVLEMNGGAPAKGKTTKGGKGKGKGGKKKVISLGD